MNTTHTFNVGDHVILESANCTPRHGKLVPFHKNEERYNHKYKFQAHNGEILYCTHGLKKVG